MVLMLEDDAERISRFTIVLRSLSADLPIRIWRDAYKMMQEAGPFLPNTVFISLDHDLEPEKINTDPGEGYMVTKWLTSQPIIRPVIIHTSNSERSSWMAGEFDLEGWKYWRVPPLGDDWIESDWRRTARRLLKRHQQTWA